MPVPYHILTLATLVSGCRWTGANPASTGAELQYHVKQDGAQVIVTTIDLLACVKTAVNSMQDDVGIVIFSDILQGKARADSPNPEHDHGFTTLHDMLCNRDTTTTQDAQQPIQIAKGSSPNPIYD